MSEKFTGLWPTPTGSQARSEGMIRQMREKVLAGEISKEEAEAMIQGSLEPKRMEKMKYVPTASQQLTLFAGDSRVNPTVLPGSEEAQRMTETSGRILSESLPNSDPATSLPRMFLESSAPISTKCYLTWKVRVTPQQRLIFLLAPSMPRTEDRESSLWPTPTEQDAKNDAGPSQWDRNTRPLNVEVKMWPTPRASEWKGTGPLGSKSHNYRLDRKYLDATVQERGQVTGKLNPTWVEWLMGFPLGWTDLRDSETP